MTMFRTILENELSRRGVSIRAAAIEIGVSHTTLIAAMQGTRKMDIGTGLAIAKWIGIPLSKLIDDPNEEDPEKQSLYQALDIVLQAAPDLEHMFREAARELQNGVLTLDDFKDIVEYAAYKIEKRREKAGHGAKRLPENSGGGS